MVAAQGGRCAICADAMAENWRCVDHDHESGIVRALLCASCNAVLGLMKDNPAFLRAAADYIEEHRRREQAGVARFIPARRRKKARIA